MLFQTILSLAVFGLTATAIPTVDKRDQFEPCSNFPECTKSGAEWCNGSQNVICEIFGSDCWVRNTNVACSTKREAEIEAPVQEKRDYYEPCSNFPQCTSNGASWCYNGQNVICEEVPFTSDCWVRNTNVAC